MGVVEIDIVYPEPSKRFLTRLWDIFGGAMCALDARRKTELGCEKNILPFASSS